MKYIYQFLVLTASIVISHLVMCFFEGVFNTDLPNQALAVGFWFQMWLGSKK